MSLRRRAGPGQPLKAPSGVEVRVTRPYTVTAERVAVPVSAVQQLLRTGW